ncbi:MAG: Hpt domain-containing protein [Marinosulfonomonas sp.]
MISWQRVNELREEVGQDDFHEVVELFLEEVDDVIDRLRASPNPTTFSDDMHFLKGGAMNLGFSDFCAACQNVERLIAQDNLTAIDIPSLIKTYETSRSEFLKGCDAFADAV